MQNYYPYVHHLTTIAGGIRDSLCDGAWYLEKWVGKTCAFVNGESECSGIGEYFQWTLDNGLGITFNILPLTAMLAFTLVILALLTRIWLLFAYLAKQNVWSCARLISLVFMACIHLCILICDSVLNYTQTVKGCLRVVTGNTA